MAKGTKAKHAIPLKDAWWHFAPKRLKDELDQLDNFPKRAYSAEISYDQAKNVKGLVQAVGDLFEKLFVAKPPVRKMVDHLLQRLRADSLEAWGVKVKPNLGESPERIPAFLFKGEPKIRWTTNTIEHLGQRFEIVEIGRQNALSQTSRRSTKVTAKRPGRPRVDEEITEVVQELDKQGKFENQSEKGMVRLVQTSCRTKFPKLFRKNTQPSPTKIREILKRWDI